MLLLRDAHQRRQTPPRLHSLQQSQNRFAVSPSFLRSRSARAQHHLVTRQLPLHSHLPQCQPHQRIEPMHRLRHRHQPVRDQIPPLQMRELVQQHIPQLLRIQFFRKSTRHQQLRTPHSKQRRTAHQSRLHDAKLPAHLHLKRRRFNSRVQITTPLPFHPTLLNLRPNLSPQPPCPKQQPAQQPNHSRPPNKHRSHSPRERTPNIRRGRERWRFRRKSHLRRPTRRLRHHQVRRLCHPHHRCRLLFCKPLSR